MPQLVVPIPRAMQITGFDRLSGVATGAEEITVAASAVPFLAPQIIGRRAWRISISNVSLELSAANGELADQYRRNFTILLDLQSGSLLSVTSTAVRPNTTLRPLPSAASAEAQMRSSGEVYGGLATGIPAVSLLDALNAILAGGIGSPYLAQEINADYVLESRNNAPLRPVWAVTLRGIPPRPAHGPNADRVPEWQRDHIRNVVDASTGKVLFATSIPQPS